MQLEFGNPLTIGIRCETEDENPTPLSLGLVLLIVEQQIIGNMVPAALEQVGIALRSLGAAGEDTGRRQNSVLDTVSKDVAMELVMWSVYGDDNLEFQKLVPDRKSLHSFEILPAMTGPAFDNWEAILIESEETETFVWRRSTAITTQSRTFPIGTFWRAAQQAKGWIERASRTSHLEPRT